MQTAGGSKNYLDAFHFMGAQEIKKAKNNSYVL